MLSPSWLFLLERGQVMEEEWWPILNDANDAPTNIAVGEVLLCYAG